MLTDRAHPHFLHGRTLGAAIGAAVCVIAALIVHEIVSGDHTGLFTLPATIVTALFVGVMGGLLFSSIIIGGREDEQATHEAEEALAQERRRHDAGE